jgi:hypothetical protein
MDSLVDESSHLKVLCRLLFTHAEEPSRAQQSRRRREKKVPEVTAVFRRGEDRSSNHITSTLRVATLAREPSRAEQA